MGDWSDKLDYEQREYYGHFYDPDREEETEEMTTVEILKEMAFTATETQRRALEDAISALSENKGEWILQPSNKEQGERDFIWWKCSVCGQVIFSETEKDREEFHAFCGRCGADMRGEE